MGEIKNVPFLKKYLFQCPTYIFCDFSLLFYHYKNIFLHYTYNIFLNFYFSHNGDEIFFSRSGINVVQEYMMMSYTNFNLIFKIKSRHTACFIILYRCPCKLEYDTAVWNKRYVNFVSFQNKIQFVSCNNNNSYHDDVLDALDPSELWCLDRGFLGPSSLMVRETAAASSVTPPAGPAPLLWLARLDRDQSRTSC